MEIRLRPTREDDLEFVMSAEGGPENRIFVSVWDRQQHLATLASADWCHLIVEDDTAERIGYVILQDVRDRDHNLQLRRIVVTSKGNGFGKAAMGLIKELAFEDLGAERLWLDVVENNLRAQHVYELAGFKRGGFASKCHGDGSDNQKLVIMSLSRSAYEAEKKSRTVQ